MQDRFIPTIHLALWCIGLSLSACRPGSETPPDLDAGDALADCEDRPSIASCSAGDRGTKDRDNDGLPNCRDPDIDGDGIANALDCAPYETPATLASCEGDKGSKDYDGDGLINCHDPDIDGDGIENERDGDPYQGEDSTK